MADSTTKQILIDIQLKSEQLKSDVVSLNSTLDQLIVKQVELKGAGQQNTTQYVALASEIRNTKTEIRNANKEIDNGSKALNAQSGSINQNKALISLMRAEYDKLSTSQGRTAASTTQMGNKIKELTETLNKQKQAVGDTTSNIGKYTQGILNAIPGMGKYSTLLTQAANAFNVMGSAGADAAEGVEALGVSSLALAGTLAAVLATGVALFEYFKQFATVSDFLSEAWEDLKAQTQALFQTLFSGKWGDFIQNMNTAGNAAAGLKADLLDLTRQAETSSVTFAEQNVQIRNLMLQMRDRGKTMEEVEKSFQQIMAITKDQYDTAHKQAVQAYNDQILLITAKANLSNEQKKSITLSVTEGMTVDQLAKSYEKASKAVYDLVAAGRIDKDAVNVGAEALKQVISVDGLLENRQQLAQNREDQRAQREAQYAQKQKSLQDETKKAIEETNSERIASITKMFEFEQEAFGKEISSTDEHYRQLIFKQEQFIEKQRAIQNDPKNNAKTKGLAGKAISGAQLDINQIQTEHYSESEKLLIDHNRSMHDIVTKGALDLKNLQIANTEDSQKRELAGIDNSFDEKILELGKKNAEYQDSINKLNIEITKKENDIKDPKKAKDKKINENELDALQQTLKATQDLLGQNAEGVTIAENTKKTAIKKTNDEYAIQLNLVKDQTAILNAQNKKGLTGGKDNPFNKTLENADVKQNDDEETKALTDKGLQGKKNLDGTEFSPAQIADKLQIVTQFNEARKQIEDQFAKGRMKDEIQAASTVANAALSIIGNANKSAAQATEVQLNKNKETELANTSLTSAQKLAINNKYRILEGQAKVKEFETDQKLSMVKIAINTAESAMKVAWDPVQMWLVIGEGVAEEAIVAAQKPPAYAKGGTFKSDGKGSVLPGYSKRDNVNAQLRSGEAVVVSEAMQNPYARNLVSAVNVAFGGRDFSVPNKGNGYAIGGIVTDGNNSNRYYAQPQEGTQNLANTIAYQMINNFPPIYADIKDINTQQSILMKTVNRVSI